ncbi:hypothetical protein GE21DRAFT_1041455 [Neurospora crassa]|nr:hypothetical protein GE21DRAFT_1041455 [Neurospora crassa]
MVSSRRLTLLVPALLVLAACDAKTAVSGAAALPLSTALASDTRTTPAAASPTVPCHLRLQCPVRDRTTKTTERSVQSKYYLPLPQWIPRTMS